MVAAIGGGEEGSEEIAIDVKLAQAAAEAQTSWSWRQW